ncbi:invasion associated locus B family protein [Chelatococcus sp. SYSU_G07232]|uniref:Invasion associated locus B family protein n=1 Tax=Chelatococcus albus TaxID=3047466 RepID=A0ABT7AK56_9HYPH|nr:invasion associated locus B family protein [Chelatococcus sp. SYSU_G07232]MDJ1159754.1 invasion associated locus B family protein [Chelatococcus sp. SYSU_G07232]
MIRRTSARPAQGLPTLPVLAAAMLLGIAPAAAQQVRPAQPAKPAANGAAKPQAGGAGTAAKPAAAKPNATGKTTAASAAASAPAAGGNQALLLATYGDWGAYASQQGKSKVCYALTQPKDRQPKNLNRDPAYLFVSTRPAENVRNEVSFVLGFAAKEGVDAEVLIGEAKHAVVTKGSNGWVKNPAEEAQVLAAMSKGAKLQLKSTSKRGNSLTDVYSLSGLSQALERVKKECP